MKGSIYGPKQHEAAEHNAPKKKKKAKQKVILFCGIKYRIIFSDFKARRFLDFLNAGWQQITKTVELYFIIYLITRKSTEGVARRLILKK